MAQSQKTPAKTPAVSVETDLENSRLTLSFANGDTLEIDSCVLSDDIRSRAMLHGLKQKLVDAAAIGRNPDTGRSATIGDKMIAVHEVFQRLLAGEWNKTREGGESTGGLLLRAMIRLYPAKTAEQLRDWLASKTPEQRAAMRKLPTVAAMILTIKAETPDDDAADVEAMLGELDD